MRIIFVTPEFVTEHNFSGGLAQYINRTGQQLIEFGHVVHVLTLSGNRTKPFDHEGMTVHRVFEHPRWYRGAFYLLSIVNRILNRVGLRGVVPVHSSRTLIDSVRLLVHLRQLHQRFSFDIVQYPSYYLRCSLFHRLFFARLASVTRISSFSGLLFAVNRYPMTLDNRLDCNLELRNLRHAQNVFSPSFTVANVIMDNKVASVKAIRVLRNPFFLEKTPVHKLAMPEFFVDNQKYMLYFGRFDYGKGTLTIAEALIDFWTHHPDVHFVWIGKDVYHPTYGSIKTRIQEITTKHQTKVHFMDALPHDYLYPIVESARFFVLPTLADNFPNACLESLALGTPVIGTNGASIDEMIEDGRNGFLVPPSNPHALAIAMDRAWAMKDDAYSKMSEAARVSVEQYHPKITTPKLIKYYEEILVMDN